MTEQEKAIGEAVHKVEMSRLTGTDCTLTAMEMAAFVDMTQDNGRRQGLREAAAECARLGLRVIPRLRADFDACVTALQRLAEKPRRP